MLYNIPNEILCTLHCLLESYIKENIKEQQNAHSQQKRNKWLCCAVELFNLDYLTWATKIGRIAMQHSGLLSCSYQIICSFSHSMKLNAQHAQLCDYFCGSQASWFSLCVQYAPLFCNIYSFINTFSMFLRLFVTLPLY